MPRTSDFIADAAARLEMVLHPKDIVDWPQGFTDHGRALAEAFLEQFDEAIFNEGFDAAVQAILGAPRYLANVNLDHPDYLRDRSEAYRKARG